MLAYNTSLPSSHGISPNSAAYSPSSISTPRSHRSPNDSSPFYLVDSLTSSFQVSPMDSPSSPPRYSTATSSSASNAIVSPQGMVHIYAYTPREGEPGTPVTARVDYYNTTNMPIRLRLRLVVAGIALRTQIHQSPPSPQGTRQGGAWQLRALVPTLPSASSSSTSVPLRIDVVDGEAVLDSIQFGHFTYWDSAGTRHNDTPLTPPSTAVSTTSSGTPPRPSTGTKRTREERSGSLSGARPAPNTPSAALNKLTIQTGGPKDTTPMPIPAFMRTSQLLNQPRIVESQGLAGEQKAKLLLKGDLNNMAVGWSQDEFNSRRRLIQFWRRQEGPCLHVAFRGILPSEYIENSIVVSCIFRDETDECYITSVDTIYLLEALVGSRFSVEEKNRIRRNLEGFRPITVSKTKTGHEDFFQLIMGFPNPKPRNIEKDVKVFPWKILSKALEKIIGKYSSVATPLSATSSHSSSSSDSDPHTNLTLPPLMPMSLPPLAPAFDYNSPTSPTLPTYPTQNSKPPPEFLPALSIPDMFDFDSSPHQRSPHGHDQHHSLLQAFHPTYHHHAHEFS